MRLLLLLSLLLIGCQPTEKPEQVGSSLSEKPTNMNTERPKLTREQANRLAGLPLKCMQQEFPNKLGQVLGTEGDLKTPKELHPAFYGCFDWHSSVHGHWMLVELLKRFPDMEAADQIKKQLAENISAANIKKEVTYFEGKHNTSYERTYGWAWLLKLSESLQTWKDPMGKELAANLEPLTQLIRNRYLDFLPKLYYPIRVGEHTNTGFGLGFAWDYANTVQDMELLNLINQRARDWFLEDEDCPLAWEPSGYDFLSPCLEEADIMRRVLAPEDFKNWLKKFLPQLSDPDFTWEPGQILDRSDGKLVHLDGLNFSRAWVLYGLSKLDVGHTNNMLAIANTHMDFSLPNVVDGDYAGEHWLASFALWALICGED